MSKAAYNTMSSKQTIYSFVSLTWQLTFTICLCQKIHIFSLAEHGNKHVKHLGLSFTNFFVRHDCKLRTQPIFRGEHSHETEARSPSVFTLQTTSFSCESLRHSHLGIMWLVCSTECKQTTNTKGKNCGLDMSSCFFWGSVVWHPKK